MDYNIKFSEYQKDQIAEDAWLNIYVNENTVWNPLLNIPEFCKEKPELYITYIMSRPEYFYFVCKYVFKVELLPFQAAIIQQMWHHKFPMLIGSRGISKSYMLAIYSLLRMIFIPGRKVVLVGGAFRQAKVIFNYMESIIKGSPFLRDLVYSGEKNPIIKGTDEFKMTFNGSTCSAIPLGSGDTIRGRRSHDTVVDEFASVPLEIFETVVAGFSSVSSNPVQNVKEEAKKKAREVFKIPYQEEEGTITHKTIPNQIIMAGTAYYSFNHFSEYHDRWRKIIKSRGDKEKLKNALGVDVPDGLNHKDYCVIRIPFPLSPNGMMEPAQMARFKTSMSNENYQREFGCVFSKDSSGFFKATVLDRATVKEGVDMYMTDGTVIPSEEIFFEPMLSGDVTKEYIIACDPAALSDNLAIVVIELDGRFRKIVHVWTTNKKDHLKKIKSNITNETNYYAYAARKIRDLMKRFPCKALGIDPGGGGLAIIESLKDKDKMNANECAIYRYIDPDKPRPDEDGLEGLHIIHEAEYASAKWLSEANHGMKHDFEEQILLFPYIDPVSYTIADYIDDDDEGGMEKMKEDGYQQCLNDIEKLREELCSIALTETANGREHWDTPEQKTSVGKKAKARKDRYSALLIANACARKLSSRTLIEHEYGVGGFSSSLKSKDDPGKLFTGPSWVVSKLQNAYW